MEQDDNFDELDESLHAPDWQYDDEALAYYLTTHRYGGRRVPDSIRVEMERIEEEAGANPLFAERIATLRRRIEQLDGATESRNAPQLRGSNRMGDRAPASRFSGRRAHRNRPLTLLRAVVPFVALLVLVVVFATRESRYADLAYPEPSLEVPDGTILLRGDSRRVRADAVDRYERARSLLVDARHSRPLGLHSHDRALVLEAIQTLRTVREDVQDDDPIFVASTIMLAKAHLAEEDPAAALAVLDEIAHEPGDAAAMARSLGERLRSRMSR